MDMPVSATSALGKRRWSNSNATTRTAKRRRRHGASSLGLLMTSLSICSSAAAAAAAVPCAWGIQCRGGAQRPKKSFLMPNTWFQSKKVPLPPKIDDIVLPAEFTKNRPPSSPSTSTPPLPRRDHPTEGSEASIDDERDFLWKSKKNKDLVVHSVEISFAQKAAALLGHSIVPPPPQGMLPARIEIVTTKVSNVEKQARAGRSTSGYSLAEESQEDRFTAFANEIDKSLFGYLDPMEVYSQVVSEYFEPEGDENDDAIESDDMADYRSFPGSLFSEDEDDELSDFEDVEDCYDYDDEEEKIGLVAATAGLPVDETLVSEASPTDDSDDDLFLRVEDEIMTFEPLLQPVVVIRPKQTQIIKRKVTKTRRVQRQTMLSSLEDFDLDDDEFDLLMQDMHASALIEEEYDVYEYDEMDPYAVDQEATVMLLPPHIGNMLNEDDIRPDENQFLLPCTGSDLEQNNDEGAEDPESDILLSSAAPSSWEYPDYDKLRAIDEEVMKAKEQSANTTNSIDSGTTETIPGVPITRDSKNMDARKPPAAAAKSQSKIGADESDDIMTGNDWEILRASDLFNHDREMGEDEDEELSGDDLEELSKLPLVNNAHIVQETNQGGRLSSTKEDDRKKERPIVTDLAPRADRLPPPPPPSDRKSQRIVPPPPPPLPHQRRSNATRRSSDRRPPPPPPQLSRSLRHTPTLLLPPPPPPPRNPPQWRFPPPPPPKDEMVAVDWNGRPLASQYQKRMAADRRKPPPPPLPPQRMQMQTR